MLLDKLITRNYLINTLVPTTLIGLLLLVLYFGVNSYISQKNSETQGEEVRKDDLTILGFSLENSK